MQELFFLPFFSFASLNSGYALLILFLLVLAVSVFLPSSCSCFGVLCPFVLCLSSARSSPFYLCWPCWISAKWDELFLCSDKADLELQPSLLGPFALAGRFPWDPSEQVPAEAEICSLHSRTVILLIQLIPLGTLNIWIASDPLR